MPYQIRKPEFLSPSAIKTFEDNIEDYVIRYLLQVRPPRPPQTEPMAVGAAFDAYVKSYLYHNLFGNYGDYEFRKLFEQQVESQNRDYALRAGKHCFDEYQRSGALADLMLELVKAIGTPRFEFSVSGTVKEWIDNNYYEVPLLGKPDCYFTNAEGVRVIYDWKVNGYCSTYKTSPMKGYICCRNFQGIRTIHRDAIIAPYKGVHINVMLFLEEANKDWADQLSIYAWLLGEQIGSENVVFGIEQITGPGVDRISSHRLRITPEWQYRLMERIGQIWEIVQSGHIFREMSRSESDAKLQMLEDMYSKPNPMDKLL